MPDKSLLIIGAGLSGLSTGCYAQMNGYRSRIFEHHSKAGGVAAAWDRGEYLIDGGIHFLMGHRPGSAAYRLYEELGITQGNRFPDLTTYGRFIDEQSGARVEVTTDMDRLARDLKDLAPEDSNLIEDLISAAKAMQGYDAFGLMANPPELKGPLTRLGDLWAMRRALKLFTGKFAQPVSAYTQAAHSPVLRQILDNLFLPEVPVWFVIMLLSLLRDRQMGLLADGCHGFVSAMEERYMSLGGEVRYGATVDRILVENGRAVGVRLDDCTEERADIVVSAADGYSTIFKLLGGKYVDEKIRQRFEGWKLIRPTIMVSWGVARAFPEEPSISFFLLREPIRMGDQQIRCFSLRLFNYSDKFAPAGKTVVQVMFETEWDYWNWLQQQDRSHYEAEKDRVAAECLSRLETHYPGLTSQVEVTDVATPYTTWRYTLNHHGAYMGWLPTPEAALTTIPKTLPGLANFYMAGQWVMPGGGVPPCLFSGRHVVQILCRRDGKRFTTTSQT